ncbi:MAG: dephospho-CoA kinase ['Candidatus Kapabacteria' thiocyanatum]|uniref:Dephospho-CoA kinase n=1 Tax=Candidatus Kapaibacterium thiocyanatum TaxID=1895771 RepID=A0A1M3L3N5_9BACT|nr:dephospho-CoA kinase ['Candidatus Kapabacteria' thiocyanatum]OJX59982.1 MAG: dephospho-CoA kinase ['Candidatus Kapabacteria' thiocyanatum]
MTTVGITGGIGTGKSTVAQILRQRGWPVYASDDTATTIMENDADVHRELVELFGPSAMHDGTPDRTAIAALVFGDDPEARRRLAALNAIVHPRVREEHRTRMAEHRAMGTPVMAIESALLFDAGLDREVDVVVVVDADDDVRIRRVMERNKLTREQVLARIAAQMPMAEQRSRANFVIRNDAGLEALTESTNAVAARIEAGASAGDGQVS